MKPGMKPAAGGALKGKQGKRVKLALVAVAAVAMFMFMRRSSQPAPAADTGVPIGGGGLTQGADTAAAAGALDGNSAALTDLQTAIANLTAQTNDRFGHFQDLEEAYGQLKAGGDPFGAIPATDSWGDPATTGAGDFTKTPASVPPAAPGNAKAAAGATSFQQLVREIARVTKRGQGEKPPKATLPKVGGKKTKKKKRHTPHTPTRPSGWMQVFGSRLASGGGGGGGGGGTAPRTLSYASAQPRQRAGGAARPAAGGIITIGARQPRSQAGTAPRPAGGVVPIASNAAAIRTLVRGAI